MHFAFWARDVPDALELRLELRPAHLERLVHAHRDGMFLGGGAMLDDEGRMVGSAGVLQAEDLEAARAWVADDPYARGGLWEQTRVEAFRLWSPDVRP